MTLNCPPSSLFRCLVYICIIKGITENPKIIYITAIYPYVVLIVFFFRAVTLEGMSAGVVHLFKPKVLYRDRLKGVQNLLSNSQAGPGRKVKQEQEEISRNRVQTF